MLWHIELKFCIWLCFTVLQIKFECRQFASIFVGVMPLLELKLLEIHSFPHFSLTCFDILSWNFAYDFVLLYYRSSSSVVNFPSIFVGVMPLLELKLLEIQFSALSHTCFDILSWNFAHDFVLMYYRSSLSVVNLCQFLLELCPFWNLKYCKYTVFRTFLLHALTYWVEILHMTFFYCTSDQVRVSSIFVCYAPFGTQNTENIQFSALSSDMLWLIELKNCIWLCFFWNKDQLRLSSICVNFLWELCPFWNFEYLKYAVYFSVTCFGILSWNFSCDFL